MSLAHRIAEYRRQHQPVIRILPTSRLAVVVALAAPLWLLPDPMSPVVPIGVLLVIAVLVTGDIIALPQRQTLAVTRSAPESVGIGDDTAGDFQIRNHTSRELTVTLEDQMPPHVSGGAGRTTVRIDGGRSVRLPFVVTGMKRGSASLGAFALQARTRLALVSVRYRHAEGDTIRVLPSVSGVSRFRLLAMQHRLDAIGVRALRRKGEGQGFAGLREYAQGDEPRHIDWKATARRGKPITREYTIERSQTVFTLIDAGRSMTQLAGTYSRFEQALSASLVLTDIAVNSGDRVGTMVFDDRVRTFVPARQSRGALRSIRDAYVPVEASSVEPDYAAAFRYLAAQQRKRALMVLFTDVIDMRASQTLMAHVARSAARHLVLVVALRNDDVVSTAAPVANATVLRAYQSAAAEEVIAAREAALEGMRRTGVVVVDASPQTMTAAVVNRYLELKARGAL